MNESWFEQLAVQACNSTKNIPKRFPPSPYYKFLELLAQNIKPRISVELGVCGGGGSYSLAMGHPLGRVIGIDVVNDYPDNIEFIKKKCPNFEFHIGDSVRFPSYDNLTNCPTVDILFIDTTHTYDQTRKEYWAWEKYLSPNSVVCLDDLKRKEMGTIWEDLPGRKIRLDILHNTDEGGFGVIF